MARDFNGTTDRLDWSSIANLTGSAITISAWVYMDAYTNISWVFHAHNSTDNGIGMILYIQTDGAFVFYRAASTTALFRNGKSAVGTGSWVHLLITHDGTLTDYTKINLYKDGSLDNLGVGGGANGAGTETQATGKWSLGGRIYDDNRNLNGRIAEVAVWDRVLAAAEIAALAAGGIPGAYPTNLKYYYSAYTDTTTAETGGAAATADGTSYSSAHPTMIRAAPFFRRLLAGDY